MSELENNFRPFAVRVEAGRDYWWCACGLSQTQPFCDGSHRLTDLTPTRFTATASRVIFFCGCKQAKDGVICDGSHKNL